MDEAVRVSLNPGHSAYFNQDGSLTIEWYDFGEDAPYESANMLTFDGRQWRALSDAIGNSPAPPDPATVLAALQARFATYWEVLEFANTCKIGFVKSVDFQP